MRQDTLVAHTCAEYKCWHLHCEVSAVSSYFKKTTNLGNVLGGLTATLRHQVTLLVHSYHLFLWLHLFISWYLLLVSFDNIAPTLLDPVFNLPYVPLVSLSFFIAHRTPFFLGDLSKLALWSPSGQGMNSIGQALKPCWFSQEWLIR